MSDEYPIPGFYFTVNFTGNDLSSDTSFQSVGGISVEISYEDLAEGGVNERVYKLPTKISHSSNLVLKRGLTNTDSGLYKWLKKIMESNFYEPLCPKMLNVMLLDETGNPSKVWEIHDALPVKWSVDDFNSTENKVALETVELTYSRFSRTL